MNYPSSDFPRNLFVGLTKDQIYVIRRLKDMGARVKFCGVDNVRRRPVIQWADRTGWKRPRAMTYCTAGYTDPQGGVRWFTEEELDKMPDETAEVIYGLCDEIGS